MAEGGTLTLTETDTLPEHTTVCQTYDGTLFHFSRRDNFSQNTVYVKWQGSREYSILPHGHFNFAYPHGNFVYFSIAKKIFIATFAVPAAVKVWFLREQCEDEELKDQGFCTRERIIFTYAYRIWEHPNATGVVTDVPVTYVSSLLAPSMHLAHSASGFQMETTEKVTAMHRGRLVYMDINDRLRRPALHCIDTSIVLECPSRTTFYVRDSTRFFYCIFKSHVYTVDMDTMQELPPLDISDMPFNVYIVGVSNGVITLREDSVRRHFLKSGHLPDGYFDQMEPNSLESDIHKEIEWHNMLTEYNPELHSNSEAVNTIDNSISELTIQQIPLKLPETEDTFISEFLDKFKPIRILGQGRFGCVFEAEFKLIGRRYAVKRIALCKGKIDLEKALKEVLVMDSFEHPGIIRYHSSWLEKPPIGWQRYSDNKLLVELSCKEFFEYRDDSAFLYIQMQLCNSTLEDWLKDTDERNSVRTKSWIRQIISAVEHIHKQNIIHRDLKPSNILVVSDEVVRICDLGIATAIEGEKGAVSWRTNIGTDYYKAPEQNTIYDQRVDIFSIGLILIEMSVVMSEQERNQAFCNIRCASQLSILQDQETTLNLVEKLTKLNREHRPRFDEILKDPYFSS